MYRLLEDYPPTCLRIIELDEPGCPKPRLDRRLKNVSYFSLRPSVSRGWFFLRTRLPRIWPIVMELQVRRHVAKIRHLLNDFKPEAVLTIHEQFGWLTASRYADRNSIPLHILLHDEWLRNLQLGLYLKDYLECRFGVVYRRASSRLCISPYMEEAYRIRYGAPGTSLFPSRALHAVAHTIPKLPSSVPTNSLKIAYGGNVFHKGYWNALLDLALALERIDGQLHLFGPTQKEAETNGLARPNVIAHGFATDMTNSMRNIADGLFLPMSFESRDEANMRISFPSKLTEYTAAGLPVIIYGPPYCSAVRWAREHPDSMIVVSEPGADQLHKAILDLCNVKKRMDLASRAIMLGRQYFSHESASHVFRTAISAQGANC